MTRHFIPLPRSAVFSRTHTTPRFETVSSIYVVPYVCALPGVAIFVTSVCFNLVSDGLRAAMDVRM
jgi:hypothetical protein